MSLAIEIRNGFVYCVQANCRGSNVLVKRMHHFEFDPEWIGDKGILNEDAFAEKLKDELNFKKFKDKKVTLCINTNSLIQRELVIPKVDERKIPLLVRSEMINNLNLSTDFVMDYTFLENITVEEFTQMRVLAVALEKSYIESLLRVMKRINKKVETIDSSANAMIKFMSFNNTLNANEQHIVVDVEDDALRLYLFENKIYALNRSNRIDVYHEDYKDLYISGVVEHINKMIQFSYTRSKKLPLHKIYLTGMDETLEAIKASVEDLLRVECELVKCNMNIKGENFENRYINVYGSLLRKSS